MTTKKENHFLYHVRDRENSSGFGYDGYIGITDDLPRRKRQHFRALSTGRHRNERLQAAYEGNRENFEFFVLTSGTKEEVEARERLLVPKPNHHWNKQTGGGPSRGMSKDAAIDAISSANRQDASGQKDGPQEKADSSNAKAHRDSGSNTNSKSNSGASSGPRSNANEDSAGKGAAGVSGIAAFVADIAATTGMVTATFASGLGAAHTINKLVLKDDPALREDERGARSAGRAASYTGGSLGATATMVAIYGAGEVGLGVAGIGSGLTAIGGTVGGAGLVGFGIAMAVPAAAAAVTAGAVYGGYKLYKWLTK